MLKTGVFCLTLALAAACSGPAEQSDASSPSARSASAGAPPDIAFECEERLGSSAPSETTLVYSGGERGALTVRGAFGEMKLPAARVDNGSGDVKTISIRANGRANVLMPDKAALETCLAKAGADPADADVVAYHLNLCQHQVPPASAPVAIDAEVTVVVIDSPPAEVFISRIFAEESAAAGGRMKLDTFPVLTCKVAGT